MPAPLFQPPVSKSRAPSIRALARTACILRTALLIAPLAFASLTCGSTPEPEFRLGLLSLLQGPMAEASGIPAVNGARLAVDELNAAGGVTLAGVRHRVVLVERDIENRPDAAATAARALINIDHVDAVVGPQTSSLAVAAATVAELSEVPLIAPMASSPMVTANRRLVFRLAFVDAFQGELLSQFAFDSLRIRRAAVLYDAASPYGRDIFRLFRTTFEERGGEIVGEETFHSDGGGDFRPQLRRLLAGAPEAILLPNYAVHDSVQMRQARELGFRGRFLGSDSWDPAPLALNATAHGSIIVANWDERAQRPATQRFLTIYRERYGHSPRATAAATYDAIRILALAATQAGTLEGLALAKAIGTTRAHEGAGATYHFRGTGDPRRGGVIVEIRRDGVALRAVAPPPT